MLTVQYRFQNTFPDHIITRIATFCDPPTLTRCLRVSPFFFNEAGKNLYKHVIIEGSGPRSPERVFRGAEIVERDHGEQAADGKRSTNFKRQLLRYVEKITIRPHTCPADDSMVPAMRQAVGLMVDLKQTIISPESTRQVTRSLCHKQICAVIAGLKCDSVTIANIRARDPRDLTGGPLNLFRPIFQHVRHATLIIPATASYFNFDYRDLHIMEDFGRPQDLCLPTRDLKTVRIIVALPKPEIGSTKSILRRTDPIARLEHIIDLLALCLIFNTSEVEIYMFNDLDEDFPDSTDLDTFRHDLRSKVNGLYEHSLTLPDMTSASDDSVESWTPNYEVYDLEHYFSRSPRISDELDGYMYNHWEFTMRYMQRQRRQKADAEDLAQAMQALVSQLLSSHDVSIVALLTRSLLPLLPAQLTNTKTCLPKPPSVKTTITLTVPNPMMKIRVRMEIDILPLQYKISRMCLPKTMWSKRMNLQTVPNRTMKIGVETAAEGV